MSRLLLLANDETTIYNFRREIVKAFVNANHQVYVSYPVGDKTSEIEELGCKVVDSSVNRHGTSIIQDVKYLCYCVKLIRQIKPDFVLTYTVKPNIYGSLACQITRTKYMNNVTGLGSILQKDSIMTKLICFLQRIGYRKSRCVFFQNKDNYRQLLNRNVVNKNTPYTILPGSGVNLSLHKYEEYPKEKDSIRFIIVSRVREDKGFNEFFEMAKFVKSKYPQTEFHIVGWYENDEYKKIIEELQSQNIICYHGKKNPEQVHELLKNSHCLIHPSYHEGMANVILEASATGRPVLASNIPGCKEGFDEGQSGFGFNVRDTESLIDAVEKFINVPYEDKQKMGIRARRKMEAEFDRNIVADIYLNKIGEMEEK